MSYEPEIAILSPDRLRKLVPDGGHVTRMPSHIDLQIGDYQQAIAANFKTVQADSLDLPHASGEESFFGIL
jgi:hypothetical protein